MWNGGEGGGVLISCIAVVKTLFLTLASLQCRNGERQVSPTRQTSRAPSAKRRELFGKSHGM